VKWEAFSAGPLAARWKTATARIDAMPKRERIALFAGALALLAAAEFLLVMPLQAKRQTILSAAQQQAQHEANAAAEAEQSRFQTQAELDKQLVQLDKELARLGAGNSTGEPLTFLLTQALARQDARVVALRELAVEELQLATPVRAEPPAGAASAASEPAAAPLYRHRFELTLGGTPAALVTAVRALDHGARPLRIERVRMAARDASSVQATITLAVIGTEKSWLSL